MHDVMITLESILSHYESWTVGPMEASPDPDFVSTHSKVSGSFRLVNTIGLDVMDKYTGGKER